MAGARGCVTAGTTKVARLAVAGGCWATGTTEVAGLAEAGGCWAAGATKLAGLAGAGGCEAARTGGGCRECARSCDMYVAWLRSATAMTAAFDRFCASMGLRRASYSLRVRAVPWIPARAASEEEARMAAFARSGSLILLSHLKPSMEWYQMGGYRGAGRKRAR